MDDMGEIFTGYHGCRRTSREIRSGLRYMQSESFKLRSNFKYHSFHRISCDLNRNLNRENRGWNREHHRFCHISRELPSDLPKSQFESRQLPMKLWLSITFPANFLQISRRWKNQQCAGQAVAHHPVESNTANPALWINRKHFWEIISLKNGYLFDNISSKPGSQNFANSTWEPHKMHKKNCFVQYYCWLGDRNRGRSQQDWSKSAEVNSPG